MKPTSTQPYQLPKRIPYLDSIRGIAAMMVLFYHYFAWLHADTIAFQGAVFFINGSDAVSFFFVLSGLVLSYKYLHFDAKIQPKRYALHRFFRLFPAFAVAVLANYLFRRYGFGIRMVTDIFWFNHTKIWEELFMMRNQHEFLTVGWTLGVEMGLSLLLPFFVIPAKQHGKFIFYAIVVILLVGPGFVSQFMLHFCLGMLIAKYFKKIANYDFYTHRLYPYRYLFYVFIFLLFSLRHLETIYPLGLGLEKGQNFWRISFYSLSSFASFFILLKVINDVKWQKRLEHPVLLYIGKISYAIYLIHFLLVFIVMENFGIYEQLFGNYYTALYVMLLPVLLVTWGLSHLMYHYVELPCIRWAKQRF